MSDHPTWVLSDPRADVVEAWRYQFSEKYPEVEIVQGSLFEVDCDAFVLPGNAFGYLDRGLELAACEHYGWELQDLLRERIREQFFGELLVGQACIAELEGKKRSVVYSCIYRTPQAVSNTLNAYLVVRGALIAMRSSESSPGRIALPGIGTGGAGLHPHASARQVRYAFEIAMGHRGFGDKNMTQLTRREKKLRAVPKSILEAESGPAPASDAM